MCIRDSPISLPLEASVAKLKRFLDIESASLGDSNGLFIVYEINATRAAPLFQDESISTIVFSSLPILGSFIIHLGSPPLELTAPP